MSKPNDIIWKNDTVWIKKSDAIIAEVTNPSLGVGYEIALAETLDKPILALFRVSGDQRLSAMMIDGAPGVQVCKYHNLNEAKEAISNS